MLISRPVHVQPGRFLYFMGEQDMNNNDSGIVRPKHKGRAFFLRKAVLFLTLSLGSSVVFSGCGSKKEEKAASAGVVVETKPAEYGTLETTTDYIATLSPNLTVDVIPLVAGTVENLPVKVGDRVKAGDLLCQLDDEPADLQVQTAEDAVRSARAGRDAAETQTDTAKIQADGNVKTLKKTLKTYEKSLDTAEKQLAKLQQSKKNIKKAEAAAKKSLTDSKKRYKTAQALFIQYESFLQDNPDCKTTAGLTAAATQLINTPGAAVPDTTVPTVPNVPDVPSASGSNVNEYGAQIIDSNETDIPSALPQSHKKVNSTDGAADTIYLNTGDNTSGITYVSTYGANDDAGDDVTGINADGDSNDSFNFNGNTGAGITSDDTNSGIGGTGTDGVTNGDNGTGSSGTGNGDNGTGSNGTGNGDNGTGSNGTGNPTTPSSDDSAAAIAKQKTAQTLLAALTQAGLTVEYLSTTGLKALKEDASDSQTAYSGASAGLGQLNTSISTLKTNIDQLKSQISTTRASLATARKLADAADAGSDVYDAQVDAALTGVDAAQYQKDLYRLTAPIDGIVDAVNVKDKGMAAQGSAAFTISEKDSMIAAFYVTEDVRNHLKIGDTASLLKDDKEQTKELGHITSIGTAVDPQKGLFKVEAEFFTTGQKELGSGTSVKVSVVSNAVNDQLLIPYDSVYYDDGQAYVYKVSDGKAKRADIETGLFNQDYITVESGLAASDEIITTWASGLKDGAEVEVVEDADAAAESDTSDR